MIDENINLNLNFYSRQIGTYGLETMIKLSKLNIFLYGLRGVGIEIAKNIMLAGPNSLTIYDNNISKINDLSSNFYINESDILEKKRRDEASYDSLLKLNPYVKLNIMKNNSIIEHLKENLKLKIEKYDVVVISEFMDKNFIIEIDNFCRENKIGFIYGTELGITGFCFIDFGYNFKVLEKSNNEPKKYIVNSITNANPGIVNLYDSIDRTDLKNDDYIIFKEIEGMNELNNTSPIKIKIIDDHNIEINDTSKFSNYIFGGIMTKVNKPLILNFESFEEKFEIPYKEEDGFPEPIDSVNPNTNEILHIGILGLSSFFNKYKYLPKINDEHDYEELLNLSKEIFKEKENKKEFWINGLKEENLNFDILFEKTIKNLSFWSRAQISPISSFLGGIIAQEIVKFTGKYMPIKQWFWCNFMEIVENLNNSKIDRILEGSRYDDQISIFGNEIQKKLENANIFMIGAGALGCELLKLFSLMGISTDKNKKSNVTVTDDDNIMESNLNRQFLFRKENIGQPKSIVACQSILKINPSFNCINLQKRIGPENENLFNQKFWKKQNIIINAVDTIEARKYIANECKKYQKILIDSGTNGTKANSQVIIPYKTIDYIAYDEDEDEQNQIPLCTLRNYPSTIEHCIEWARDNFNGYFVNIINDVKSFIENKENYYLKLSKETVPSNQILKLKKLIRYLNIIIKQDFNECIKIAIEDYNEEFYDSIIRVLKINPKDSVNSDGSKFWKGNKRCPTPLPFNINNNLSFLFIKEYSYILANSMSIPIINDDEYLKKFILDFYSKNDNSVNEYENLKDQYNQNNKTNTSNKNDLKYKKETKEEIKKRFNLAKEQLEKIKEEINKINITEIKKNINNIFNNQEFEKDNDENGHIDFIFASANLRAQNFNIEKCNKIKTKLIAGKIIPSIATTTASIAGLVCLQLYTLCQTKDIKYLRDCYINLSFSSFHFCNPGKYQQNLGEEIKNKGFMNFIFDKIKTNYNKFFTKK